MFLFEKNELHESLKKSGKEILIRDVFYGSKLPSIKPVYKNGVINLDELGHVFLQKLDDWESERETRFYYEFTKKKHHRNIPFTRIKIDYSSFMNNLKK